jgi:hypothetical protein
VTTPRVFANVRTRPTPTIAANRRLAEPISAVISKKVADSQVLEWTLRAIRQPHARGGMSLDAGAILRHKVV